MQSLVLWWRSLADAPQPLTRSERIAAWLLTLLMPVTRWLAVSRTPWDSDEGLFISALKHFDVHLHHPHPPGFPLFIATAKLFTFLGIREFRALQFVAIGASCLIVPAAIFLGRELRANARVSMIAAAFLALFPNVWYFGGTGLSDVPSMTLIVITIALLLRGARSDGAFIAASVLLGIAIGYRSQNLLIAALPALIAIAKKPKRAIAFVVIVGAITIASYGAAAHFSGGWAMYRESIAEHEQYISKMDSFRSPLRPPMYELFDNFFIRPYDAPLINTIITALVIVSGFFTLWRLRASTFVLLATFAPFCIAAWALLDRFSTSRFSIGYAPLVAFFAADGLDLLLGRWPRVEAFGAAAVASILIVWTWPALMLVHSTWSPPFYAVEWLRAHVDPKTSKVFVHDSMQPLCDALLDDFPRVNLGDHPPLLTGSMHEGDVYVREGMTAVPGAVIFERPRNRIASIARATRYFEASIIPLRRLILFPEGWYEEERLDTRVWRWTGARGRVVLPPRLARMQLSMVLFVPIDVLPHAPNLTITFNGKVIDRIHATTKELERTYDVDANTNVENELLIQTDETINPAARGLNGDTRDLGVRLNEIEWRAR